MRIGLRNFLWLTFGIFPLLAVRSAGAQSTRGISVEEGLVYGVDQGSALLADVAYPSRTALKPAIIYVHGGSWRGGSRNGNGSLDVAQWAGFGFFAMTIDYRLVLATPAPAPYQDLLTAIRWVHAHAAEYGIDPDRVYLIGNSAGGHLVSLAATLGDGPFPRTGGWDTARSDVRAVITVSGAYDVNTLSWGDLWTPQSGDPEDARRLASPVHHLGPNTKPMLLIHSNDDQAVPVEQALNMVGELHAAGVEHRFVRWEDTGHMGILPEVVREARAFIAEVERR
jgi:acetyl esterase/lipase